MHRMAPFWKKILPNTLRMQKNYTFAPAKKMRLYYIFL